MHETTVYRALTWAGAIPFLALAVLPWVGVESLGPLGDVRHVLAIYGLAIVSFLCGTHWTFELTQPGNWGPSLFIVSNVLVVAAWFAVVAARSEVALGIEAATFITLLAVDARIHARGGISADYWRLRQRVTAVVLAALVLGALA